ncbi:response regulator transcription factor [Streptomyces sp. NPDC050704]|uniref:response regulator transcription factor n=1 Tax=Streptomyces sp. NPDC050704 TaxID=3157219 RepID=UPI003446DFB7
MATVLIVNDQSLQRLGFRMLLAAQPGLTVVGEAATGAEAVRMSAELHPDVVLMDSHIPDKDSIEAIRRITRPAALPQQPGPARPGRRSPHVLILTTTSDDEYTYGALRAGACGLLPQDATPDELTAAIHSVAAGNAVITSRLTRELIDAIRQLHPVHPAGRADRLDTLTARERDVLTAVASGWSNAEIAARLSIAQTTVKSHITRILTKTGARARVQAVVFAYESGLVRPA